MVRARVTSKGQVTLPVRIRRRYRIEAGDDIDFKEEEGGPRLLPLHRRKLTDLAGIFPATKPHMSIEEIRREVGRKIGEDLDRRLRKR